MELDKIRSFQDLRNPHPESSSLVIFRTRLIVHNFGPASKLWVVETAHPRAQLSDRGVDDFVCAFPARSFFAGKSDNFIEWYSK